VQARPQHPWKADTALRFCSIKCNQGTVTVMLWASNYAEVASQVGTEQVATHCHDAEQHPCNF
jgi:hypothetical protein